MTTVTWTGRDTLDEVDPEIRDLIGREKQRQINGLELIASEVHYSYKHEMLEVCLT